MGVPPDRELAKELTGPSNPNKDVSPPSIYVRCEWPGYTLFVMGHLGHETVVPAGGARLEAVSGPLKGKLFLLSEGEVSIGRDPSNQISLLDGLVSRRHCVIHKQGEAFRIQDLESRNNTFVSGVPIRDRVLVHGDEIRIGNSIFVFQGANSEPTTDSASLQLDATPTPGGPTVILRKEDVRYLQPLRPDALPATTKTVRDLRVLLDFGRTLNSVRRHGGRAGKGAGRRHGDCPSRSSRDLAG